MQYRQLGKSNLKVSALCLGTMMFGQQTPDNEAARIVASAKEHGINFIDAAEMYPVPPKAETQGRTESYIGTWLKKRKDRDKIVLATKEAGRGGGPRGDFDWLRDDKQPPNLSRK